MLGPQRWFVFGKKYLDNAHEFARAFLVKPVLFMKAMCVYVSVSDAMVAPSISEKLVCALLLFLIFCKTLYYGCLREVLAHVTWVFNYVRS